jgi:hypothetical protein
MSRTLLIAALCALAAGCAHRVPAVAAGADAPLEAPLVARLLEPQYGMLRFSVSREAHVAVFEIVPGQGTSLIYPTADWQDSRVGGFVQAHLSGYIPGRDVYFRNASPTMARYAAIEPRYLLLIASERPLKLRDIQHSPSALYHKLGFAQFSGYGVSRTMNALAELVVPNVESEDWAYDYWMLVPPAPAPRYAATRVSCYDPSTGALYVMPAYFGVTGLIGVPSGNLCPARPSADVKPAPVDSSGVEKPKEAPKPGHREPMAPGFLPRVAEQHAVELRKTTTAEPLDEDAARRIAEDSKWGADRDRDAARIERMRDSRSEREWKGVRRGPDAPASARRGAPRAEPPANVERRTPSPAVEKRVERAERPPAPRPEPRASEGQGRPAPVRAEPKRN